MTTPKNICHACGHTAVIKLIESLQQPALIIHIIIVLIVIRK